MAHRACWVFFLVLKVISDITHWDLLIMFEGTVSIINNKLDLCVNERTMESAMISIVPYL